MIALPNDTDLRDKAQKAIGELDNRTLFMLMMILTEVENAKAKHPSMGVDLVHAAAVVAEESGELVRAALLHHYEGGSMTAIMVEAIQTAATSFRMLTERC